MILSHNEMPKIDYIKKNKFQIIAAFIFIIYSIFHYLHYGGYSEDWGVDQASIELNAKNLLNGIPLNKETWKHGIGYSIIISPFLLITKNPLNIAGFFLFTITAGIISRNVHFALLRKRSSILIVLFIFLSLVFSPDMKYWVIGASNTTTAIVILLSILWSLSSVVPRYLPIILGVLSGFVFSSRYLDYFLLFPLYFSAILNFSKVHKKSLIKSLIIGLIISSLFVFSTLILHKIFLGDFLSTPYSNSFVEPNRLDNSITNGGIANQINNRYFSWIIPNLYSTLIDYKYFASELTGKGAKTALSIAPILIFAPYSIVNFFNYLLDGENNNFKNKLKITALCTSISLIAWILIYGSWWASTAHDLEWYGLRFYMGWFTIIIFLTLYGLTLKPNFKTIFISSLLYILLFNYPYYFIKNQFSNYETIKNVEVYNSNFEGAKRLFNLPIPFDNGKKSLLAITREGFVIVVDNYTNNLLFGECSFNNLSSDLLNNNFNSCNYFRTQKKYESENGMEFIAISTFDNWYEIEYKILEGEVHKIKKFMVNISDIELENQGSSRLVLDKNQTYKVIENNKKVNFVKRNNLKYSWNENNIYWPDWPLLAAERINSTNLILTKHKNDPVFCIWELDNNWNHTKDRLCSGFGGDVLENYEKEFGIDIDKNGFINSKKIKPINLENLKPSYLTKDFIYKVDPIKFELNNLQIILKDKIKKGQNIKLDIKLKYTGNGIFSTFPSKVEVSCIGEKSCKAYKIGRFNNLWRLWIRVNEPSNMINFKTSEIAKMGPSYWPINYIAVK